MATALDTVTRPALAVQVSKRRNPKHVVGYVVLAIGGLVMIAPFLFMLSTSFNADARDSIPFPPQLWPAHPSTDAYDFTVGSLDIWRLYGNTLLVAGVDIVLSVGAAFLSGYALSKIRPPGSRIFLAVLLATMMIPGEATLIPNFLTFSRLHLLDTYWPLWLPSMAYPFGTFLVKQYLDALPTEMREAARVDGASDWRILRSVYLPLCKGLAATLVILQFLANWNSYLWPLIVINSPEKFTIQLGIASFASSTGAQSYSSPSINMAATVLSLIPVLAVYLIFQRHIIQNVANASVKG
ncbi:carbohydrate ABC transporter permease [Kribbella sp. GL6]|uniref:carbohydrate ABC transporter permease n=1 Tax=Kribbella sp. GL6 TaxID=3419765 RepID=UPI003D0069DF